MMNAHKLFYVTIFGAFFTLKSMEENAGPMKLKVLAARNIVKLITLTSLTQDSLLTVPKDCVDLIEIYDSLEKQADLFIESIKKDESCSSSELEVVLKTRQFLYQLCLISHKQDVLKLAIPEIFALKCESLDEVIKFFKSMNVLLSYILQQHHASFGLDPDMEKSIKDEEVPESVDDAFGEIFDVLINRNSINIVKLILDSIVFKRSTQLHFWHYVAQKNCSLELLKAISDSLKPTFRESRWLIDELLEKVGCSTFADRFEYAFELLEASQESVGGYINKMYPVGSQTYHYTGAYGRLLHRAINYADVEAVELLLSKGADITLKNDKDINSLAFAMRYKSGVSFEKRRNNLEENQELIEQKLKKLSQIIALLIEEGTRRLEFCEEHDQEKSAGLKEIERLIGVYRNIEDVNNSYH